MGTLTLTWWCCGSVNVMRDGSDLAFVMERGEALLSEYHFACHDLVSQNSPKNSVRSLLRLMLLFLRPKAAGQAAKKIVGGFDAGGGLDGILIFIVVDGDAASAWNVSTTGSRVTVGIGNVPLDVQEDPTCR